MRNCAFIRMAESTAKQAGYNTIYKELKKAHEKLKQIKKDALGGSFKEINHF